MPRLNVDKLAKVTAMFSSPYDGERAVAAALADRMVKAAGLTWPDVLAPTIALETSRCHVPATPGDILARCSDMLTEWEKTFLASLVRQTRTRSPRQQQIFSGIRTRFEQGAQ